MRPGNSTRDRILAAATAVFAERDFHRVQVSDVAVRAGVGKGTVYLYFPTKDELHTGALTASLDGLAQELERSADTERPVEVALREIVLAILRFFWKRQHLLTVVQRWEQQGAHRRVRRQRALGAIERVLARSRLGGSGAARRLSAAFLLGLARAGILEHGPGDRPEALATRIVRAYLHGIAGGARQGCGRDGAAAGARGGRSAAARAARRGPAALVLAVAVLGLGVAACGGRSEAQGGPGAAPAAPPPVVVTVAPVAVRPVERTVSVVGTLLAYEEAELASETEGQVIAVEADLGDRVARGQVLARIRADVPQAQLREAEASLQEAVANEGRARPLRAEGIVSPQEYEKVRTALEVARARRDRLAIELQRTAIRAPFDGSVSARRVSLGDYVRPGTVVFGVVQDDPLKFRGEVPEREVPALQAGQELRIGVAPYPGETFLGRVARVGSASDPQARSLAFEATVPNTDHRLRPGFFGHAEVVVRRDDRAVAVPRTAVSTFAGVTKLFVVEEGVARERQVVLGEDLGDGWVEVRSGVARGMHVATSGLARLSDGAAVTVRADGAPGA